MILLSLMSRKLCQQCMWIYMETSEALQFLKIKTHNPHLLLLAFIYALKLSGLGSCEQLSLFSSALILRIELYNHKNLVFILNILLIENILPNMRLCVGSTTCDLMGLWYGSSFRILHLKIYRMITAADIHFWMAPGMVFSTGTPSLHWTRNVYWRLKNQNIHVKIR